MKIKLIFLIFSIFSVSQANSAIITSTSANLFSGMQMTTEVDTTNRFVFYKWTGVDATLHGLGVSYTVLLNTLISSTQLELDQSIQAQLEPILLQSYGLRFFTGGSTGNRRGWFAGGTPELVEKSGSPLTIEGVAESITKCITCTFGFAYNSNQGFAGFTPGTFEINSTQYQISTVSLVPVPSTLYLMLSVLVLGLLLPRRCST